MQKLIIGNESCAQETFDFIPKVARGQGLDLVFQAAALKQVPSSEFFPLEAVPTNALGAGNVMNAALTC